MEMYLEENFLLLGTENGKKLNEGETCIKVNCSFKSYARKCLASKN